MKRVMLMLALAGAMICGAEDKAPKAEELKLAYELLEAEGVPVTMETTLQATLEEQMKGQPELLPMRSVFENYLRRSISYEALKEELAKIYLKTYTPEEIRGLIAFYRTPLGKKKAAAEAEIASSVTLLTQNKMKENMPLFAEEFKKELEKQGKAIQVVD